MSSWCESVHPLGSCSFICSLYLFFGSSCVAKQVLTLRVKWEEERVSRRFLFFLLSTHISIDSASSLSVSSLYSPLMQRKEKNVWSRKYGRLYMDLQGWKGCHSHSMTFLPTWEHILPHSLSLIPCSFWIFPFSRMFFLPALHFCCVPMCNVFADVSPLIPNHPQRLLSSPLPNLRESFTRRGRFMETLDARLRQQRSHYLNPQNQMNLKIKDPVHHTACQFKK